MSSGPFCIAVLSEIFRVQVCSFDWLCEHSCSLRFDHLVDISKITSCQPSLLSFFFPALSQRLTVFCVTRFLRTSSTILVSNANFALFRVLVSHVRAQPPRCTRDKFYKARASYGGRSMPATALEWDHRRLCTLLQDLGVPLAAWHNFLPGAG